MVKRFNLRVYAIITNSKEEILLSKERRNGFEFTKFPGGGVEFGEGILGALYRELKEELRAEIESASFFYVNDFFQASSFRSEDQVISFYYWVTLENLEAVCLERKTPIGCSDVEDYEQAIWVKKTAIFELLTFPIDRIVASKMAQGK